MDRDDALRLLRSGPEGIAAWNRRRMSGEADLREIDLKNANLNKADLRNVDLSNAELNLSQLCDANLARANLNKADLTGAQLIDANLSGSSLIDARLRGADLGGASLASATLIATDLNDANLADAQCNLTVFTGIDFADVKGLDLVQHLGPSTIGLSTIFRTRGRIPEAFLRGCGVPRDVIARIPELIDSIDPSQFYSCFISYSHKDEEFAKQLHSRMVEEKLRVWYAPEDMPYGQKLHDEIETAIRVYDKLLLVLSRQSMDSEWVRTEIRKARKAEIKEKKRKLFPIRLVDFEAIRNWECFDTDSGKDLAVEIREYLIPDFSNWKAPDAFEAGFARLVKSLKAEDSTGATAGPGTPPQTHH
jgi:hypothetical protein